VEKSIRILLVEDNEADIHLIKYGFKKLGIIQDLYIVRDGEQAINFLNKQDQFENNPTPEIILLDLNLPKKNGTEVLAEIKSNDALKNIPVLILSTASPEHVNLNNFNLQADSFFTKPVDYDEFTEMIKFIEKNWFQKIRSA
jgi:CheY-like chemotaxis protein